MRQIYQNSMLGGGLSATILFSTTVSMSCEARGKTRIIFALKALLHFFSLPCYAVERIARQIAEKSAQCKRGCLAISSASQTQAFFRNAL